MNDFIVLRNKLTEIEKEIDQLNIIGQDLKNSLNKTLQINQETFQNSQIKRILETGNTIKKELSEKIIPEINNSL